MNKGQAQRVCYLLCNKKGEMRKYIFTPSFKEKKNNTEMKQTKTNKISYLQDMFGWQWGGKEQEQGRDKTSHYTSLYRTYLVELCWYFTYFLNERLNRKINKTYTLVRPSNWIQTNENKLCFK